MSNKMLVEYDLTPAQTDGAIQEKLRELGWMSPSDVKELKAEIMNVRLYAADNVPTKPALVIIHKLETIMKAL